MLWWDRRVQRKCPAHAKTQKAIPEAFRARPPIQVARGMNKQTLGLHFTIQVNAATATTRMVDSSVDVAVTTTAREAHHPRAPFGNETFNAWFRQ